MPARPMAWKSSANEKTSPFETTRSVRRVQTLRAASTPRKTRVVTPRSKSSAPPAERERLATLDAAGAPVGRRERSGVRVSPLVLAEDEEEAAANAGHGPRLGVLQLARVDLEELQGLPLPSQ